MHEKGRNSVFQASFIRKTNNTGNVSSNEARCVTKSKRSDDSKTKVYDDVLNETSRRRGGQHDFPSYISMNTELESRLSEAIDYDYVTLQRDSATSNLVRF
jgi:hypothetical protein